MPAPEALADMRPELGHLIQDGGVEIFMSSMMGSSGLVGLGWVSALVGAVSLVGDWLGIELDKR